MKKRIIQILIDSFLLSNSIICIRDGLITDSKNMDIYILTFLAYIILTIFSEALDKVMTYELEKEHSRSNKEQFVAQAAKEVEYKETSEDCEKNEQSEKMKTVVSIHEAGHALMAVIRKRPFDYVHATVNDDTYAGNLKLKTIPQCLMTSDDFLDLAYITYGGIAAEKELLGQIHGGCIGSDNSDFELAEKYIIESICLSSEAKSKIKSYPELIKDAHSVSNIVYKNVLEMVKTHKEELKLIVEAIREKGTVFEREVIQMVEEFGYREITFLYSWSIERAVEELIKYKEKGESVYGSFNGHLLYSDTVTIDSAYLEITGMSKEKHDEMMKEMRNDSRELVVKEIIKEIKEELESDKEPNIIVPNFSEFMRKIEKHYQKYHFEQLSEYTEKTLYLIKDDLYTYISRWENEIPYQQWAEEIKSALTKKFNEIESRLTVEEI